MWSFVFSGVVAVAFFVACGGSGERPTDAASSGGDGGTIEASVRDALADTGDSGTCKTKAKDGTETDVDCGGSNDCPRCELGQVCESETDCAGGAKCTNKLCALCEDDQTNGDETDRNCGGKACAACTVGKRCVGDTDCRSGKCVNQACACPANMTIISIAGGGAYCVDQAEVSKGQYNQFITANVPVNTQAGACLTENQSFIPRGAWPPQVDPGPLAFNFGLPVHYVDWCDAAAYCTWAKKQLCSTLKGDAPVPVADSANATVSAWFNACTAQGALVYPYGNTFDGTKCNTDGVGVPGAGTTRTSGFGFAANLDDGVYDVANSDATGKITGPLHTACQGGSTGIYQMSGNVAEWENSCDGASATSKCRVRGGSYASASSADQTCAALRDVERMPAATGDPATDPLKDIGFRCCQY